MNEQEQPESTFLSEAYPCTERSQDTIPVNHSRVGSGQRAVSTDVCRPGEGVVSTDVCRPVSPSSPAPGKESVRGLAKHRHQAKPDPYAFFIDGRQIGLHGGIRTIMYLRKSGRHPLSVILQN